VTAVRVFAIVSGVESGSFFFAVLGWDRAFDAHAPLITPRTEHSIPHTARANPLLLDLILAAFWTDRTI